jgi:hypothetical protein
VEELLTSLNSAVATTRYHSPIIHTPDPPDCVCLNAENGKVAIEVVEVVDQQAVHLNEQGHSVYRVWNEGELAGHIGELLRRKDTKLYHGGPYAETIVCLFTDETMLVPDNVARELAEESFGPFKQLTGAILLFSYGVGGKPGYAHVPLCINTANAPPLK